MRATVQPIWVKLRDANARYGRQRLYRAAFGGCACQSRPPCTHSRYAPSRATAPVGVHFIQGSILDPVLVREALDDVDDVYHLAALPGMWMPNKNDFHAVNCCGTQVVIVAARERGVSRFLHCSTESILFGASNNEAILTEEVRTTPDEMPGAYTRSKLAAEQLAMQAATSGFPVVIANPTMPIGPHGGNFTPPMAMLRHFLQPAYSNLLRFRPQISSTCATSRLDCFLSWGAGKSVGVTFSAAKTSR